MATFIKRSAGDVEPPHQGSGDELQPGTCVVLPASKVVEGEWGKRLVEPDLMEGAADSLFAFTLSLLATKPVCSLKTSDWEQERSNIRWQSSRKRIDLGLERGGGQCFYSEIAAHCRVS